MKDILEKDCIVHVHNKKYQVGKTYNDKVLSRIYFTDKMIIGEYDYSDNFKDYYIFQASLDNVFIEYNVPESKQVFYIHDKEILDKFILRTKGIVANKVKRYLNFVKNILTYDKHDIKIIENDGKVIRFDSGSMSECMSLEQANRIIKIKEKK